MKSYGIFYGMTALCVISAILLIFPRTILSWWKVMRWYLIFGILIGISYSEPRGWNDGFLPQPEALYKWLSILYVALSLIVIVVALLKKAKQSSQIRSL